MSVYKKLQQARAELQKMQLKKSGHNKFAGYQYFELADFLPAINDIFNNVGLCGVTSFSADLATLRIIDTDGDGEIVFTSPMAEASLKGCHPIQNLGAVETYQRRYLWVMAMEIVEHDALDSGTGKEPVAAKTDPPAASARGALKECYDKLHPDMKTVITDLAEYITYKYTEGMAIASFKAYSTGTAHDGDKPIEGYDNDMKMAVWYLLDPKVRSAIKSVSKAAENGDNK